MLSICIPVYNVDVTDLVTQLIGQAEVINLTYEVCIFDDGSNQSFKDKNRVLTQYYHVVYVELEKNLGSAAIRNELASRAKFNNLLFIDSDSGIPNDYLAKYKSHLTTSFNIVCGRAYSPHTDAFTR